MIATVRIAPVERWCEWVRSDMPEKGSQLVGMEVTIRTETFRPSLDVQGACGGHVWILEPESQARVDEIIFGSYQGKSWWCEHMLEMD